MISTVSFVNDNEIETIVTDDPTIADAWVGKMQSLHEHRLRRLIVGLATEWHPSLQEGCDHTVATLRLCVGKSCLIFPILHSTRIPHQLRKFLGNTDYTFVGVGIKDDQENFFVHFGLDVASTSELCSWAAVELDCAKLRNVGLKELVQEILGEEYDDPVEKPENSVWLDPEFTKDRVAHACLDAYLSLEIGRRLSAWY